MIYSDEEMMRDLECMLECMSEKQVNMMRKRLNMNTKQETIRGKRDMRGDIAYKDELGVYV